jgi:chromosomal replication initiation ATPase DnaA
MLLEITADKLANNSTLNERCGCKSVDESCKLTAMLVADAFRVPLTDICAMTRGSPKHAEARQVAMYLAHVALEIPVTSVGKCFGRDHSTVAHGCRKIEDRRDCADFDLLISELALSARIARHLDAGIGA